MPQTNRSIFESNIFNLPKLRYGTEFPTFLKEHFKQFENQIKKFKGGLKKELSSKLPLIFKQQKLILEAVNLYYRGFPSLAYEKMKGILDELNANNILPISKIPNEQSCIGLYRMRISDNKTLQKKDLFHIPFQFREKVSTQRYSIPGLPCLYLGDSIFVCWEELSRPNFDNIHVSRFDLSESNFRFLYFNVSVDEIRRRCFPRNNDDGKFPKQLVSFLSYFPLFTACSTIVDKPLDVFKPEYIIPQLVLQWVVATQKLDGIQYKSNRVSASNHNLGTFTNIVMPVKQVSEKNYCSELIKAIKLTNPISWQLLDISTNNSATISNSNKDIKVNELRQAMYIELIPNEKTYYLSSKFGLLEEKLKSMTVDFIKI